MASPKEDAASRLAEFMNGWKSIEIHVHQGFETSAVGEGGKGGRGAQDSRYVETADGRRSLESRTGSLEGGTDRVDGFCDGNRCATVVYNPKDDTRQNRVMISRDFVNEGRVGHTDRPMPLRLLYVGKSPIHEGLARSIQLANSRELDRECEVFKFPKVRWAMTDQTLIYSLDKESSIPLKVESFLDEAASDKPLWTWRAKSFDRVQGRPFVLKSEQLTYVRGTDQVYSRDEIDATLVRFDHDYPASSFWPNVQPGVVVFDSITKKTFETPGAVPVPPGATNSTAHPIRADLPNGWSGSIPGAAMVLGVSVILIASLLAWRSRENQ